MTCIAAITDGATVWVGGDSAGVAGSSLEIREDKKVFIRQDKDRNTWVFGFTGSFRMMQLAHYDLELPSLKNISEADTPDFMVTQFIPRLRKCLAGGGWQSKVNNRETTDGAFIVGITGRLFVVQSDYQVGISHYPFVAIGSGKDLALGTLFALNNIPPEERILKALEAAETFSTSVRKPFHIVHS